jgi:hypothetical protein
MLTKNVGVTRLSRTVLNPSLVDDPLFRKALVTTVRMDQSVVCMDKGTALGKRDTTLSHRHTFSENYSRDRLLYNLLLKLDEYHSKPLKGLDETMVKKIHNVFMSVMGDYVLFK